MQYVLPESSVDYQRNAAWLDYITCAITVNEFSVAFLCPDKSKQIWCYRHQALYVERTTIWIIPFEWSVLQQRDGIVPTCSMRGILECCWPDKSCANPIMLHSVAQRLTERNTWLELLFCLGLLNDKIIYGEYWVCPRTIISSDTKQFTGKEMNHQRYLFLLPTTFE